MLEVVLAAAVEAAVVEAVAAQDKVPLASDSDVGKELRGAKKMVKVAARAARVAALAASVARPTMQPDGSSIRW